MINFSNLPELRWFARSRGSAPCPTSSPIASRRQFLYGAGVGALSVGVVGVGASSVLEQAGDDSASVAVPTQRSLVETAGEPIVAVLRDASTGEFALLAGEREVIVIDKALAATFSRAVAADRRA